MNTLLFTRHGKTKYTGQFPDLTDEGKQEFSETAEHIAEIVGNNKTVQILSSPLPRALGSADIIARRLGLSHAIEERTALRCADFYDPNKVNAIWESLPNVRDRDHAYASDPRFEDGMAIEKRSDIQYRFLVYLGVLFKRFTIGNLSDATITVSHYEVLYKLAGIFGLKEPLIHGEIIKLELSRASDNRITHVRAAFRESHLELDCSIHADLFRGQIN